ncbi:hypothetical protein C8J57DRAFT_1249706 [Mycena rebaudengoi]|nr:hypothetical protein C8J57DRAFT_1249706 [Mycena rebaudengoi]
MHNAQHKLNQAVAVDIGNGNGFAIRTVKELKQNTQELKLWKAEYDVQHAAVQHYNLAFIKKCVLGEDVKLQGIMRTPTMDCCFHAFNHDLELITLAVWVQLKPEIFTKSNSMHEGKFPPGTVVKPTDCVQCNFCRAQGTGPRRYPFPSTEVHEALQPVSELTAAVFGERAGRTYKAEAPDLTGFALFSLSPHNTINLYVSEFSGL